MIKIGRTHLMDATPVRLGQEFGGYAKQIKGGKQRILGALRAVEELPLGGTAVGTGLNCHPDFPRIAISHLSKRTRVPFREAADHFEAQSAKDGVVEASGQIKAIAVSLFKIANDIRWLGSGPSCGIGEIALPATQPGSSIMPGKVNPVMCEAMMQVCAQVFGGDATVTWAAAAGSSFELNVMMPVLAHNFLENVAHPEQRHPGVYGEMRARHHGERRALQRTGRVQHGDGHEPRADHRLRPGGGDRQGKRQDRQDGAADLHGAGGPAAGTMNLIPEWRSTRSK